MQSRSPLQVVDCTDLPEYPVSRDMRLDAHAFVKWHHNRWLNSPLQLCGSYDAKGMARDLYDLAQNQCPVGTLPDDDVMLSRMLRLDLAHWQSMRPQPFGPLHGWVRCLSEGEVRLMHRDVLEQVQDALSRREMRSLSKEEAAERKRFERLREGLGKLGVTGVVLDDGVLMARLDVWLAQNCKGNRTRAAYEAVLVEAHQKGWLARAG